MKAAYKWIGIAVIIMGMGGCNSYFSVVPEVKTDSARYIGRMAPNLIEVSSSGIPEDKEVQTLRVSEQVRAELDAYELNSGDTVEYDYYLNEQGQKVVTTIKLLSKGEPQAKIDSGRYVGQLDINSIEIRISGVPEEVSPRVFRLSEVIKNNLEAYDLHKDDVVKFTYIPSEEGLPLIIAIEKI